MSVVSTDEIMMINDKHVNRTVHIVGAKMNVG